MTTLEEIIEHGEFLRMRWSEMNQVLEFYFNDDYWLVWYCHNSSAWMTEFVPF